MCGGGLAIGGVITTGGIDWQGKSRKLAMAGLERRP